MLPAIQSQVVTRCTKKKIADVDKIREDWTSEKLLRLLPKLEKNRYRNGSVYVATSDEKG